MATSHTPTDEIAAPGVVAGILFPKRPVTPAPSGLGGPARGGCIFLLGHVGADVDTSGPSWSLSHPARCGRLGPPFLQRGREDEARRLLV